MDEIVSVALSGTADDLWAERNWAWHAPRRPELKEELGLLERLFPLEWRRVELRVPGSKHQMRSDLVTPGGQGRLLLLAAELLRVMRASGDPRRIPTPGRLRDWRLYEPTKSELLVGPLLREIGEVKPQPAGAGHGADYLVHTESGVHVAEVKRACTAARQNRIAMDRSTITRSGPIFTPEELEQNTREDALRLYPRVHHAAKQLKQSANSAVRRFGRSVGSVPGILFLDLDGNASLVNVRSKIDGWMALPWARSIDLVLFFDYNCREDAWGLTAEPIYSRTGHALDTLARALPRCDRPHFHVGNLPTGPCKYPLPF